MENFKSHEHHITIIDAIDPGGNILELPKNGLVTNETPRSPMRNHRYRVTHSCPPETLLNNIRASIFDYLSTPQGQDLYQQVGRRFTYDEVPLIPASALHPHGIDSIVAEKAKSKFTVSLLHLFGAPKAAADTQ